MRVNVPFKFVVGNTTLAAGEYNVSVMKPGMLQLDQYSYASEEATAQAARKLPR